MVRAIEVRLRNNKFHQCALDSDVGIVLRIRGQLAILNVIGKLYD